MGFALSHNSNSQNSKQNTNNTYDLKQTYALNDDQRQAMQDMLFGATKNLFGGIDFSKLGQPGALSHYGWGGGGGGGGQVPAGPMQAPAADAGAPMQNAPSPQSRRRAVAMSMLRSKPPMLGE